MIELYKNKADCCACGACASVCPKNAISLESDEYGFTYPVINNDLCIQCAQCTKVCAYQNKDRENTPVKAYAAFMKDSEKIMRSTSGGAFAVLADKILSTGGIVFGAAMEKDENGFTVRHIPIENTIDLPKILKSKYVQSFTANSFKQAKEYLENGKTVLYSGTPCQIVGLKGYLKKDYDKLITVDLVCHGVPSLALFRSYISFIEKRDNITITDFDFRDKQDGWASQNRRMYYTTASGEKKSKSFDSSNILYSYFELFKNSALRENCYTCKYASDNRPADLSLGDCWGISKLFYESGKETDGKYNDNKGVSCIILNTQKGIDLFESTMDSFECRESSFTDIAAHNTQLRKPSVKPDNRSEIMEMYKNGGYAALDKRYGKILLKKKVKAAVKKVLPKKAIELIKG